MNFSTVACNAVVPTVTITSPTNNQTLTTATPSVAFTTTGSPTSVTCKVDTVAPANCTSPTALASLTDGSHTVTVTASNAAGTSSAVASFNVDTTPPDTLFTDGFGDGDTISTATATYRFAADDSGATFQCKIDSGTYASCTSPFTTPSLANGTHTVYVRGVDAFGNADASPAQRTVIVSVPSGAVIPTVTITTPTANQAFNTANVPVVFTTTGSPTAVTCKVDAGAPANCTSQSPIANVADGSHTLTVTVSNSAGTNSAVVPFSVDTTPPETTFTGGPADGATIATSTTSYQFGSS